MRNRFISKRSASTALTLMSLMAVPGVVQTGTAQAAGQAAKTDSKPAAKSGIRRMPDGHPDLQGTYDLATMTPLERMPNDPVLQSGLAEALWSTGDSQSAVAFFTRVLDGWTEGDLRQFAAMVSQFTASYDQVHAAVVAERAQQGERRRPRPATPSVAERQQA